MVKRTTNNEPGLGVPSRMIKYLLAGQAFCKRRPGPTFCLIG